MKKKRRLRKWVYNAIILIFLLILIAVIVVILRWNRDNQEIAKITDHLSDTPIEEKPAIEENTVVVNPPEEEEEANDYWDYIKMDMLSVDFKDLLEKNKDTVGWIKVNGTNINYPVVQTTDNQYYLKHSYEGTFNYAGWIFADYRNDLENFGYNTIIYGHGRLDTTMFGSLKNILESDWYDKKENHIVKLSTPTHNTLWQVFSIYTIEAESYYIQTEFANEQEFADFVATLKERSQVTFAAEVNSQDKILTLSTCKNDYGIRLVLHAKLIKQEMREAS